MVGYQELHSQALQCGRSEAKTLGLWQSQRARHAVKHPLDQNNLCFSVQKVLSVCYKLKCETSSHCEIVINDNYTG